MTTLTSLPVAPRRRASPRVRRRRRALLLTAAILATVAAGAMVVSDNRAAIGKAVESAWWTFDPAGSVAQLAAASEISGFDLDWAANDRASAYTVTIGTDASLENPIKKVTTTATSAAFDGLDQGTTYFYQVTWASELGNAGVASQVLPVTTDFHRVLAPETVSVSATASSFDVTWSPVLWATEYVVRMSTSKDPAAFGSSPADVEFAPTVDTSLSTPALSKAATGEKYYFTVRADNRTLSTASSGVKGGRLLIDPPAEAAASGASASGVSIAWSPVSEATRYVIERSSTPEFATVDASYDVPRAYARTSINGLEAGTGYYFRVRAENGKRVGQASSVVAAATRSTGAMALRVATYNVLDPRLGKKLAPWSERRKNLAATIDSADADIVALQEAGWSRVSEGRTPAQDLKKLIGKKMVLSKAGYKGDQLLYSPAKLTAGRHGSFRLPRVSGDGVRSAIWQEFRDKATGTHFIAISTHLTSGIDNNAGRARQAKAILAKLRAINAAGLPVVMMGDLNSYDARASTTPMSLFADAGYLDAELTTPETATPTLNTWVKATSATGSIRFDHIAVSDSVAVTRTAIENPKLKGPASDHRLLWADLAISLG